MKPVSLADISYEQGLQLLTLRKQALDSGVIRRMPKEAMDNSNLLRAVGTSMLQTVKAAGMLDDIKGKASSLLSGVRQNLQGAGQQLQSGFDGATGVAKNWWEGMDPAARDTFKKGLIGSGLGAGAGLGASVMNGDGHYGRNMLMGGVAGGAIGGGVGIAQNPGISDIIQKRLAQFAPTAEAPDAAPAEAPDAAPDAAGSKQPEATPPKGNTPADVDARRVLNIADPGIRENEVNSLRSKAESTAPEAVAAGLGAASVGLPAYGIRKLHNMEQYSQGALRDTLLMKAKPNKSGIKAIFGESMTPDALRRMPENELLDLIKKHPKLKKTLLGNASNPNAIRQLLGNVASDPVSGALSRGFKRRPFRAAGVGGLLAAGGLGLKATYDHFRNNDEARTNAQNVLSKLVGSSGPARTITGGQ